METPYPKPTSFSDPGHGWSGYGHWFQDILNCDPEDLDQSDFCMIFQSCLPAANYEEGVYYLDACFHMMSKKSSTIENNLCSDVFWFINHHQERLSADGLLMPCLSLIADLWRTYTAEFDVMRLTDAELKEYGIDSNFRECVKYDDTVHCLVDALVKYELFQTILNDLLASLAYSGVIGSCWWVEIAYHARWWYVTHRSGREENARKQNVLHQLLAFEVYPDHERCARDYVRGLGFGEYYKRVRIV